MANVYKNTLDECGLSYVWLLQGEDVEEEWRKSTLQRILLDQFLVKWRNELERSTKCDYYRHFKLNLTPEMYLTQSSTAISKVLLKIRTCNHSLPIEKGRYMNIDRRFRLCSYCDKNKIGDEFHYFFECTNSNIANARQKYIPQHFCETPTLHKFYSLMKNLKNDTTTINIYKFVKVVLNTVK